ncbi:unnamed protein product [Sympodiomycopsis kandeliae]
MSDSNSTAQPVLGLSDHRKQYYGGGGGRRLKTSMRARRIVTNMDRGLKRRRLDREDERKEMGPAQPEGEAVQIIVSEDEDDEVEDEDDEDEDEDDEDEDEQKCSASSCDGGPGSLDERQEEHASRREDDVQVEIVSKANTPIPDSTAARTNSTVRSNATPKPNNTADSKASTAAVTTAEKNDLSRWIKKSSDSTGPKSSRPRQSYLCSVEAQESKAEEDDEDEDALRKLCRQASDNRSGDNSSNRSVPQVPLFSSSSKREIQRLTSKNSLQDEANPITHSTVGKGSMHYVTSSTGHQVQNRLTAGGPSSDHGWWATRMAKLKDQFHSEGKETEIFKGISTYINGYVGTSIGNKELIRLLSLNGATIHYLPNKSTTHIISSMPLSAKKRNEMLQLKSSRVKKFVKVEWVLDSIESGKRKAEHLYAHPIQTQKGIAEVFLPTSNSTLSNKQDDKSKAAVNPTSASSKLDWRQIARIQAANISKPRGCS